ncbi:MAG: BACON domain-containing protein [Bacteroidales bacterium]|nr:BACON domain-containing protein [Bacteroidales bacterium]
MLHTKNIVRYCLILLSIILLPECAKGIWKDNIRISADELTFEAQGGSLKVWSKSGSEFSLDSIYEDGKFPDNCKKVYGENNTDIIGLEGEWLKVSFEDMNIRTSLIVSVKHNDTGNRRAGSIHICNGDFYKTVRVVQKAE